MKKSFITSGPGVSAHLCRLARAFAACTHTVWIKVETLTKKATIYVLLFIVSFRTIKKSLFLIYYSQCASFN